MRRKTPKEKTELDYDKQRRTHWDNQKAARKAIPAAKRAARQIIRKRSNEKLASALDEDEDASPTANELVELERDNRFRKFGAGEILREHVKHIKRSGRGRFLSK
ncbi:MAG: hypothetical protein ACRD3E_10250 [Terriglobales bacterium]